MYIEEIPPGSVPTLAKLLQFRPNEPPEALSRRLLQGVKSLPSFLRPSRLEKILLPPRGHLCQVHKCLHYDVVDVVLHHVQLEVGIRLNNLISQCDLLSPEQYVRVMRLRALHALWLTPEDYEKTFLTSSQNSKWSYQSDRCRACMLCRLTSDLEILLDLRWAVRSRATQNFIAMHGSPKLQLWVQVWIAVLARCVERATGQEIDLDTVLLENEQQAVALKKVRVNIEALRKEKYKYMKLSRTKSRRTRAKGADSCHLVPNPPGPPWREAAETATVQDTRDNHAGEDLSGEPNEADLEAMDAFEALTSTTYLPGQSHLNAKYPFESTISSVSGDPSTKGQSPYGHCSSYTTERASMYSVVEDPLTGASQVLTDSTDQDDEQLDYVSPRSQWKASQQEQQTLPSTVYSRPTDSRGGHEQLDGAFSGMSTSAIVSSRDSWETEPLMASSSSIYSAATTATSKTQKRYAARSRQRLARVDEHEDEHCWGSQGDYYSRSRRDAAETYTDLLDPTPFTPTTTSETLSRPGHGPGACTPPTSASELFLRLYDDVCRPVADSGSITTIPSPSKSTTSEAAPHRSHVPSTAPPRRRPVSSTEDFLHLYGEVVSAYSRDRSSGSGSFLSPSTVRTASTSTVVSDTTRKRLTPERLSVRASTSTSQRHNDGRRRSDVPTIHGDVHVHMHDRAVPCSSASISSGHSKSRRSRSSQSDRYDQCDPRDRDSRTSSDVQSTSSGECHSQRGTIWVGFDHGR
ncbi:uncharacterized protein Z520_09533 [Fonsecaea multimorphosa CBS 102226]|uniref:Uncharacterized protein n=1 Tax=Fonsecaea multimorphosa CBS 102226 TaxID=1442371 RepID=A0A0D2KDR0_9EURO|nr:uncharacterized protein Z520_09533 [Fonsecaea multimorphosa CBS 102226]KIX94843.1 hypothetical protein Z520_09533 [Fonsecaea multimorphosa CBS 102226]OAL20420.1 hypothetical protein AYO22_08914 [Fonsecaea multimorphosa]